MTFRASILILMTAVCCSSQEEKKPYMLPKETLDAVQRHHGISEALATARVPGREEIVDLATLDDWVAERYKLGRKNADKPLRSYGRDFVRVLREDEDKKTAYAIRLEFWLRNNSEETDQAAAMYLFNVPIRFRKGSFSGPPVGDWTESWYNNSDVACLVFIRRNVFVRLAYEGPYETAKQDPKMRRHVPDASLRQKCEDLARDIDQQLERLPGKKPE